MINSNLSEMTHDVIRTPEAPNLVKHILLLATAGVIAKIVFSLLVSFIVAWINAGTQAATVVFSAESLLSIFMNFPHHLLAFGLIIALAYQYRCVALNARNLVLCASVGIIVEALYLAFFMTPLYGWFISLYLDWADNRGWSFVFSSTFQPLAEFAPLFVVALVATVLAWAVFGFCAKPDTGSDKVSQQQKRFIMLLAFTGVLGGLLVSTTHRQTATAFYQFMAYFLALKSNSLLQICAHLLFVNISLFIFMWLSYQFCAAYFPKEHIADKRNVIAYALLALVVFMGLCIATGILLVWGVSALSFYGGTPSEVLAVCIPVAIVLFIWVCARITTGVAIALLGLCAVQFAGVWLLIAYLLPDIKVYQREQLLTAMAVSITIQMIGWMLYSFAIQIGVRRMVGEIAIILPSTAN